MEYNDYELVYLVKENEEVLEYMMEKYEPLFQKIARSFLVKYKNTNLDVEDVVQYCRIVFCKVIELFNPDAEVLFITFLCFPDTLQQTCSLQLKKKRRRRI